MVVSRENLSSWLIYVTLMDRSVNTISINLPFWWLWWPDWFDCIDDLRCSSSHNTDSALCWLWLFSSAFRIPTYSSDQTKQLLHFSRKWCTYDFTFLSVSVLPHHQSQQVEMVQPQISWTLLSATMYISSHSLMITWASIILLILTHLSRCNCNRPSYRVWLNGHHQSSQLFFLFLLCLRPDFILDPKICAIIMYQDLCSSLFLLNVSFP